MGFRYDIEFLSARFKTCNSYLVFINNSYFTSSQAPKFVSQQEAKYMAHQSLYEVKWVLLNATAYTIMLAGWLILSNDSFQMRN